MVIARRLSHLTLGNTVGTSGLKPRDAILYMAASLGLASPMTTHPPHVRAGAWGPGPFLWPVLWPYGV